jgi:hypothetical protein
MMRFFLGGPMAKFKLLLSVALVVNMLALAPRTLWAQDATGRVIGTITDPSGLVIQNATVTVTNTSTSVARTTKTDREGNYQVLQLPIGPYAAKVDASGFATAETKPVELRINQSLRFDIQMKLGSVSQTIQVNAARAAIETVNSSLGNSITGEAIAAMPLNGRNVMSLIGLQAGATDERLDRGYQSSGYSVSGGRTDSVAFLLDGTANNDLLDNGLVLNPNPDMIQEFRLITSNGTAEFGRNSGGIVSAVVKSGTDAFHGSFYDYVRNEDLNANRYFFNQQGLDRPILKRNQFGLTFNGPAIIPKVIDGHGKLFFSIGYQGQSQRSVATGSAVTVFTPGELTGDFSKSYNGGPDPGVASFLSSFPYFQPNASLAAQAIISPQRINSIAKNYINAQLVPSSPSGSISPVGNQALESDEFTGKVDYNITSSDRLNITFGANRQLETDPFDINGNSSNTSGMPFSNDTHAYLLGASYTKFFSQSLISDFRMGAQRRNQLLMSPPGIFPEASDLGMAITPDLSTGPPLLQFISGLAIGAPARGPRNFVSNTFSISEALTWISDRHTVKTGFSLTAFQNNMLYDFRGNGVFRFYGPYADASGNDLADFLLGLPTEFIQSPNAPASIRTKAYAAYAQDEWHIAPHFVLTFGLRYEYSTPKRDTRGRTFSIIPGKQSTVFSNAPKGLLFPGDADAPEGVNFPDRNDFAPRFGFAWSPGDNKTSLRGGFGVYYDMLKAEDNLQFNGQAPFFSSADFFYDALPANPSTEPINFANPYGATGNINLFPSKPSTRTMDFSPFLPFGGSGVYAVDPHLRTPYSYQYNFTIQRELAGTMVAQISYVGNSSHKLTGIVDINPYVKGQNYRLLNSQSTANFSYLDAFANIGASNYNSLQLTLEKHPGKIKYLGDASFKLSYTYGHAIDNSSGYREMNRGAVPFSNSKQFHASGDEDIRHRMAFSGRWELPFENLCGSRLKPLTQGWVLYPIVTWRTGFPVDVFAGLGRSKPGPSGAGDGQLVRANLVGSAITFYDPGTSREINSTTGNYWFNPNNFSSAVSSGYGSLGRNAFRGPGRTNVDLALDKEIPLARNNARLHLRFEAFNLFNTIQWREPDSNINSATFGQITDTYDPRIMQLALRLSF